ncbi:YhfG family protein [Massilia scottii]|uniref:YhfG family protein n=1 Tax=Massilia scottii TaxID=3057166 RepID=UPI0035B670A0
MLTNEKKRQVFLKLRTENYRASLRLEGLVQRPVSAAKPVVEPPLATLAPADLLDRALTPI